MQKILYDDLGIIITQELQNYAKSLKYQSGNKESFEEIRNKKQQI